MQKKVVNPDDKKDWIKTSFWVPEMTPQVEKKDATKPTK